MYNILDIKYVMTYIMSGKLDIWRIVMSFREYAVWIPLIVLAGVVGVLPGLVSWF